jgi:hypothetical protein
MTDAKKGKEMRRIAEVVSVRYDFQTEKEGRRAGASLQIDPVSLKDINENDELRRVVSDILNTTEDEVVGILEEQAGGGESQRDEERKRIALDELNEFIRVKDSRTNPKDDDDIVVRTEKLAE